MPGLDSIARPGIVQHLNRQKDDTRVNTTPHRDWEPTVFGDTQDATPYTDAVEHLAQEAWQRLSVPGHQGQIENSPKLGSIVGERILTLDLPSMFTEVDHETMAMRAYGPTPRNRALALAAQAWGGKRAWWLTNGASMGNQIASLALRILGDTVIVQRSMHSSAIHGMILAGLSPVFVQPTIDHDLGSAHGVTAAQIEESILANPGASSVFIVSPSYFGAVADVGAIADVAHRHGLPLVVDESWGAHFGFHPDLPVNSLRLDADLVISSTQKLGGSLFQSAIMFVGFGEHENRLETAVERVYNSLQSTSSTSLLQMGLDAARHSLASGYDRISRTLGSAARIWEEINKHGRFGDATSQILSSPDVIAKDPFKIVVKTRPGGLTGSRAHHLLMKDHQVFCEMSTPGTVVALLGAQAQIDVDRFITALHELPVEPDDAYAVPPIPATGPRRTGFREAYFREAEVVPASQAVGRVSADSLAAYPPGIPNVFPGEELTPEIVDFLRATASTESGYVRGAVESSLACFRVLKNSDG